MPLNNENIQKLREWLNPEGAIAGLEESRLTVSELYDLAKSVGGSVDKNTKRRDIIIEIVNRDIKRLNKSNDELLCMKNEELRGYIEERLASRTEIMERLFQFDIIPGSEDKKKLVKFMAREISEIGMYERVANGRRGT